MTSSSPVDRPVNDLASCQGTKIEEKPESAGKLPISTSATSCVFPEGGLQVWMTVLGVWIIQFSTFGYTNAYGVYNDFYIREYMVNKYASSQMSWVGNVQLMLVLSVGLVSGRLYDTGYFYHLMIGGGILFIFCLLMLSLMQPGQYYQIILAQGIGAGLAIGLMYVPGISVVSHYFQCRRSFAMGVATSGSGLGGVIQPIMLNKLFHGPVGFHNGVRISAAFNAGLLLIAIALVRTRLPPSSKKEGSILLDMSHFFREGTYATTVVGTIITICGLFFPVFFLQLNAIKNGISSDVAFYAIPVMNVFTVVGRIVWPAIVPWIGIYNVIIPCVGICSILIFCSIAVKTVAATFSFATLYSLFAGGYMELFAPMVGSLARKDSEIGARMGICFTFTGLGGLVGTPIAGALVTSSYTWWKPIMFSGLCTACGALLFACARFGVARSKSTQKV
ncbi:major facilitator superfamily domain-containing protein [Desarmillaria tabescens]|uniref:Major facilitator superfamily domain-containing protein n=1 Tax=Armillaria tabescens TaxID=1929756 RepID=A0AA39KD60_ARMTA|nr:major facilitator superfamily domain-containing protein [Desarmillaria tabescens]KAK0458984.1 major facilitator superfamily domain-containing protein [Desarmillaria tabescens]